MANKNFGSPSGTMSDAASDLGDMASRMTDKASELGHKAAEVGQKAVGAIDAQRGSAASALDSAADQLVATADYVRDNKMRDMWSDLADYVKAHPAQALLGAVVVGFCAGRMLRRS